MRSVSVCFLSAVVLTAVLAACSAMTVNVPNDGNPIGITAPQPAPPPPPPEPAPAPQQRVRVEQSRIAVDDKIHFNTGSADIAEQSFELLNEIARVLRENPHVRKVQIEGHTDNQGAAAMNLRLSQQRADAVRTYLVNQGIDAGRLVARGFGLTRPVDTNDTEEGRSKNRRVEFNILEQDPPGGGA